MGPDLCVCPLRLQEVSPGKDRLLSSALGSLGLGKSAFQRRSEFGCLLSVTLLIFAHGSFQDLPWVVGALSFVPEVSLAGSVSGGDKGAVLARAWQSAALSSFFFL